MRITAIIPCHNGVDDTRACLASLLAQNPRPELELVVVDNGSTDDTAEVAREFASVRVVSAPTNLGFAGGVNLGLRELGLGRAGVKPGRQQAASDLVLIVNNDTIAAPGMLARLQRALLADANIGAVAPVSNHVKGPARLPLDGLPATPESAAEVETVLTENWAGVTQDVSTLSGLCLLLRRATFDRLGAFDPRFGIGNFEDDDLCLRARLLGYRLVLARDAFLFHRGHRTFKNLGVDYAAVLRSRQALFEHKWRNDPAGAAVVAAIAGNAESAAQLADEGLRCHPRWPDGHVMIAQLAFARGEHRVAKTHLERFVAQCPRHSEAQAALALTWMYCVSKRAGQDRLARALATCFFTETSLADLHRSLGVFHRTRRDFAAAAAALAIAVELLPCDLALREFQAVTLFEAGQTAAALDAFRHLERQGSPRRSSRTAAV